MFNHLESGNCPSGIEHDDILELAANFVRSYKPEKDYIFFCYGCQKPFRRMCDLLQHSETSSCNEGYWRGSGYLGSMVTYIATCIPDYIPDPDDNDDNNEGARGNGNDTTSYPNISIPKIVITGPTWAFRFSLSLCIFLAPLRNQPLQEILETAISILDSIG